MDKRKIHLGVEASVGAIGSRWFTACIGSYPTRKRQPRLTMDRSMVTCGTCLAAMQPILRRSGVIV